ncbi:MAG: hydrogenase maturation protease [Gammaproteobacteria bacterium]|nr:hydrogenase maturation protease [Gammaproteobacteria bacterium]
MDSTVRTTQKTLVLGLGNAMLSDLGAGIEVVHRLRRRRPRLPDVDLLRAGLVNVSLARVIGEYDGLIVAEARPVGGDPGTVVELHGRRMDRFLREQTGDDASLADILALLDSDHHLPKHRALLVVQPASARVGHGLSRPVAAALPAVLARIEAFAHDWNTPENQTPGAARTLGLTLRSLCP